MGAAEKITVKAYKEYQFDPDNLDLKLDAIPADKLVVAVLAHNERFIKRMVLRHAYGLPEELREDLLQEMRCLLIEEAHSATNMTLGQFTKRSYWKLFNLIHTFQKQEFSYKNKHVGDEYIDAHNTSESGYDMLSEFISLQKELVSSYVCEQIRERLPNKRNQLTFDVILAHNEKGGAFTKLYSEMSQEPLRSNSYLMRRMTTLNHIEEMLKEARFKDKLKELLLTPD